MKNDNQFIRNIFKWIAICEDKCDTFKPISLVNKTTLNLNWPYLHKNMHSQQETFLGNGRNGLAKIPIEARMWKMPFEELFKSDRKVNVLIYLCIRHSY